jgi:hypothetical protein
VGRRDRLITDVVKRLAGDLRGRHAYVCGRRPWWRRRSRCWHRWACEEKRIYYDKFTDHW